MAASPGQDGTPLKTPVQLTFNLLQEWVVYTINKIEIGYLCNIELHPLGFMLRANKMRGALNCQALGQDMLVTFASVETSDIEALKEITDKTIRAVELSYTQIIDLLKKETAPHDTHS